MVTTRVRVWRGEGSTRAAAVVLALAVAVPIGAQGCFKRPIQQEPQPPASPPPAAVVVPPPDPVPPPTEAELAAAAAGRAESYGMYEQAASDYERAARLATSPSARAEAHWALARLWADPANPARNLDKAAKSCQATLEAGPSAGRQPEARMLQTILSELAEARSSATALRAELEAARSVETTLKEDLRRKDQELESIKKVLLEKKP